VRRHEAPPANPLLDARGGRSRHAPLGWERNPARLAERPLCGGDRRARPDAVAFYVSGQLLTEDYYVFNKLAKGLVGTNNIDTNSRLCMSSAVAGYKQSSAPTRRRLLRRHRPRATALHRRLEHRVGAPDPVPPHRGREGGATGDEDRRRRPAPHRDRRVRRPALQIQPGTDVRAVQRHAARDALGRALDRRFIAATRPASTR
jgi:hypothetical protein